MNLRNLGNIVFILRLSKLTIVPNLSDLSSKNNEGD